MRDGLVRKEGITAAAATVVGEATGTRGRATAAATGAEGSGSSKGMEPPWKSLSVIVVTAFFFDMAAAGAVAEELAGAGR